MSGVCLSFWTVCVRMDMVQGAEGDGERTCEGHASCGRVKGKGEGKECSMCMKQRWRGQADSR